MVRLVPLLGALGRGVGLQMVWDGFFVLFFSGVFLGLVDAELLRVVGDGCCGTTGAHAGKG